MYQEALAKARELGVDVAILLVILAEVARKQERFSDAEALYEEALAHFESVGDDANVAYGCVGLAEVRVNQGRYDMARAPLRRALSLMVSLRSPVGIGFALEVAALAATDARSAARLLGNPTSCGKRLSEPRPQTSFSVQAAAAAVDALGKEQFDAAYTAGRALSLDDAVGLALEVIDA